MNPILSVKNLTKEFKNFKAVDGVSFEVGEGEIFGLLGPNGAGKTTIIRVIATVLAPTSGTAKILDYDIVKNSEEVRKNIGVLTTDIGVYERFSGRENLHYFGELYGLSGDNLKNRINELAELLDMKDFLDRKAGKYSTGMKQKLAIARSVIHDPKVLIFDEPTSGLDVLASQTVRDFMIKSKQAGKCVIFSTHQMRDAEKLCDRVVIIHKGKVIANDKVEVLKSQNNSSDLEDVFMKLVKMSF
jgi:sodium transport system ATP-binding protein